MTGYGCAHGGITQRGGPLDLDGRRVAVLGAGVSGVAAARLVCRQGATALVLDEAQAAERSGARDALRICGATYCGGVGAFPADDIDLCVASPAFALGHPWLLACEARGIPVVSELELGARYWPGRLLAVTGSKGKSSLVKLCADATTAAGITARPAGNYGTPLCELVLDAPDVLWAIIEVSSFQLELAGSLAPDVAVLLNVQPDHLDRHGSLENYRRLKERLFAGQTATSVAILPAGYEACHGTVSTASRKETFGADSAADWRYENHSIMAKGVRYASLDGTWFDNPVLGLAAAAGCAALAACALSAKAIEDGLRAFVPLPHRLQQVAIRGGVRFIDDSKATSLAAVGAALQMLGTPVRLIAGGRLKESALDGIKELLTTHAQKVYLIGECARQMECAWRDTVSCEICGTIDRAVARAVAEAAAGETVLLSPGTASFDQFRSYHERGERFVQAVHQVTGCTGRSTSQTEDMR